MAIDKTIIKGNLGVIGYIETTTLKLEGSTFSKADIDLINGITSSSAELNKLDGFIGSVTELNYIDGVTSNIQAQINTKFAKAGGDISGSVNIGTGVSNTGHISLNLGNSASPQIELSDGPDGASSDMRWAIGGDDIDNSLKIHGSTTEMPIINNIGAAPFLSISTSGEIKNLGNTMLNVTDATNSNTANKIVQRDSSGNFSAGTISAEINGNVSTATKLKNSRTIDITGDITAAAVAFDGSADIAISASVNDNSHNHTSSNISDATSSNTGNMIVKRDVSGNFYAGIITANQLNCAKIETSGGWTVQSSNGAWHQKLVSIDTADSSIHRYIYEEDQGTGTYIELFGVDGYGDIYAKNRKVYHTGNIPTWNQSTTGNAATATKLATARTITLTGDASGSTTYNGSANSSINVVVANNSHTHTSSNISDATNANTGNMIVKRDSNGDFSARTITAALVGNAATASKLSATRIFTLNGDVTGSASFDGSASPTITTVVGNNSHTHISSNISDATSANTANMVVKRSNDGSFNGENIEAEGYLKTSSEIKLGTQASIQFNATTNSIDFIFN